MARREEAGVPLPLWHQQNDGLTGGETREEVRNARGRKKRSKDKRSKKGNPNGREQENADGLYPLGTSKMGGSERSVGPKLRTKPGARGEDGVRQWSSHKNPMIPLSPIDSFNSNATQEDAMKKKQKRSRGGKGARAKQRQIRMALKQVGPDIAKLEGSDLEAAYERARVHMGTANVRINPEDMLLLYGLFKQIVEGDVKIEQPPMKAFVANQKYIAWKARKGRVVRLYEDCLHEKTKETKGLIFRIFRHG